MARRACVSITTNQEYGRAGYLFITPYPFLFSLAFENGMP